MEADHQNLVWKTHNKIRRLFSNNNTDDCKLTDATMEEHLWMTE